MYYLFNGTYAGFLCCIFESFERMEFDIIPLTQELYQSDFFQDKRIILTDVAKAKRVQDGLIKKIGTVVVNDFYRVFLSEDDKAWQSSFKIMLKIFNGCDDILNNYGDADVLLFAQTLKKVNRERHRMKAFTRFQKDSNGMFVATIEPDFNVLPLIATFFKNRYTDQEWLIYDVKRKYGLLYDKNMVREVTLTPQENNITKHTVIVLDDTDELYERLWKQYYKSTNIETRKNMKLHLQHVPKRYWKYLPEKQV